jgi:hypothetical protein
MERSPERQMLVVDARARVECIYGPDAVADEHDKFFLSILTGTHEVDVILTAMQIEALREQIGRALDEYRKDGSIR